MDEFRIWQLRNRAGITEEKKTKFLRLLPDNLTDEDKQHIIRTIKDEIRERLVKDLNIRLSQNMLEIVIGDNAKLKATIKSERLHIDDIEVYKPILRDLGIGKLIMQKAEEFAVNNNLKVISLECRDYNVPFFKKLGFEQEGIVSRVYYMEKKV